jgi:type 1 glutamine amidotransferase
MRFNTLFIMMTIRKLSLVFFAILFLLGCAEKKKPLHIGFISAANEYVTHITLNEYKDRLLQKYPDIEISVLQGSGPVNAKDEFSEMQGTEVLKECDVVLVFARRTTFSGKALEDIRNYLDGGKPFVALRTASHGFQGWPEFDSLVLGGNYQGHYEGEPEKRIDSLGKRFPVGEPTGEEQFVTVNAAVKDHPVLKGITDFKSKYSLYKTSPVAPNTTLLLTGTTSEGKEPVAWTRDYKGGRLVYIALGGLQDWKNPLFEQLVTNALFWVTERSAEIK